MATDTTESTAELNDRAIELEQPFARIEASDEIGAELPLMDDVEDSLQEEALASVGVLEETLGVPPVAVALGAYAAQSALGKVTSKADLRGDYLQRFSPMVRRIAHHMLAKLPASVQLEDLIQAGLIGLMDAVNRFEEGQGAQFETYAMQRIRGAMLDELRSNDWLPRGLRKTQRTIEVAIHKLEQRLGRAPVEREIAAELGLSLSQYQTLLLDARGTQLVYLDDHDDDGDSDNFLERNIPDKADGPSQIFNDLRFREALVQAIDVLPDREKTIMGLYYEQELNFREIASILGVTESRICQIHTQIVARLRVKLREW